LTVLITFIIDRCSYALSPPPSPAPRPRASPPAGGGGNMRDKQILERFWTGVPDNLRKKEKKEGKKN